MGRPEGHAVDAELVRPTGQRLQLQPGEALAGVVEGAEIRDRVRGVGVAGLCRARALAAGAALAAERQVHPALARHRAAGNDRPVELLYVARAEGACELGGDAGRAGQDEDAGGVTVEAVDESRALGAAEPECVQQAVEMPGDSGAALDGEAGGLLRTSSWSSRWRTRPSISRASFGSSGFGACGGGFRRQRRHAHLLARREARGGFGTVTVHANLPGTAPFLDAALGNAGEVAPEPAVEPHAPLRRA